MTCPECRKTSGENLRGGMCAQCWRRSPKSLGVCAQCKENKHIEMRGLCRPCLGPIYCAERLSALEAALLDGPRALQNEHYSRGPLQKTIKNALLGIVSKWIRRDVLNGKLSVSDSLFRLCAEKCSLSSKHVAAFDDSFSAKAPRRVLPRTTRKVSDKQRKKAAREPLKI